MWPFIPPYKFSDAVSDEAQDIMDKSRRRANRSLAILLALGAVFALVAVVGFVIISS